MSGYETNTRIFYRTYSLRLQVLRYTIRSLSNFVRYRHISILSLFNTIEHQTIEAKLSNNFNKILKNK